MKKLLLLFLLFTFSLLAYSQEKNVLGILMKDGTSAYFLLEEKPLITFVDEDVCIVSETDKAVIKRTLVDHFEFTDKMPTGIEDVKDKVANGKFELAGNVIHLSGLASGCKVQVFSINGQAVSSAVANEQGAVVIPIDSLPSGIYLVNYNEITIKFIKS